MPSRHWRTQRRARAVEAGESFEGFFRFLNTGSGRYQDYVFDASEPEQGRIRNVLTCVIAELHRLARQKEEAREPEQWRRRFEGLVVVSPDEGLEELKRLLPATALQSICQTIVADYFVNPRFNAYRDLQRCTCGCNEWFLKTYASQKFKSPQHKRELIANEKRSFRTDRNLLARHK